MVANWPETIGIRIQGNLLTLECTGFPGIVYDVETSTNLIHRSVLAFLPNSSSGIFLYNFAPPSEPIMF